MAESDKRGYLSENYRLFHISDKRDVDFESHFHDFHKVIICLSGNVTYIMEGKTYFLKARDILFVPKGEIHKSCLSSAEKYERVVIWVKDEYLRMFEDDGNSLATCFDMAKLSNMCIINPTKDAFGLILQYISEIEALKSTHLFGKSIMKDTYFSQLFVVLTRLIFEQKPTSQSFASDPKFDEILHFINSELASPLSVEVICKKFFVSRSYLMHRFKELTGCSVHEYIIQKRMNEAFEKIRLGTPANIAASESGFSDYTVFYRNFKKTFGVAPAKVMRK